MDRVHTSSSTLRRLPCRLSCGFLIIPLLLLSPAEGSGQAPSDRVLDFLESASGFHLLGTIHNGVLNSGHKMGISVTFLEDSDYMVVGYCDDACTNLDLTLFDPSGEEIQADRLPDSEPILALTAESSGRFHIQVETGECSDDGCEIAVGIFGSSDEMGGMPGEDMAARLTLFGAELMSMGFSEIGEEKRGSLNTDQTITIPVTLQEGWEYRMAGVCDMDCFDLDLVLFDPRGAEVAFDVFEDALPILAHTPDTTGEHKVEVIMVACDVEPCAYRIATYAKGEGVGPGGTTFSGVLVLLETHRGRLDPGDGQLPSGAYLDVYEVEVQPGQRIIVDLRSDDFDTLLRLLDPEGEGKESDVDGEDPGHSHIEIMTLKEGSYSIQVTSFSPESSGAYFLQIAVVE